MQMLQTLCVPLRDCCCCCCFMLGPAKMGQLINMLLLALEALAIAPQNGMHAKLAQQSNNNNKSRIGKFSYLSIVVVLSYFC